MEHIREALLKANTALGETRPTKSADHPALPNSKPIDVRPSDRELDLAWAPPMIQLSSHQLEARRIISAAGKDPAHVAFNILRTRVQKTLQDNNWKTIAVTSPTPGCGKTMVALNLAYSLSRMPNCRTVLIDLDLKRPSVAETLAVDANGSIAQFLEGTVEAKECFIQLNKNLIVGLNNHRVRHSAELLQSPRMSELLKFVSARLSPDIILFDLPPMQSNDDVLAFLPQVDSALLVVAAGATTATQLDECEQQISQTEKLLGIVMNKSQSETNDYYHY